MARGQLSQDTAFALLSTRRRRQLLCVLVRCDDTRTLQSVAREIIVRLDGTDPDDITDEAYRSVYVSLYQNHAPKLADEGIVHYDEAERTVRLAHNRRTETLLRIVGIDPDRAGDADRTVERAVAGLVGVAALCGLLAFVDGRFLGLWAVFVAGLLVTETYRRGTDDRIPPVRDCGDLATGHDS
jgi:hypothetical protein